MRFSIIEELSDTQASPITVAVFSDSGMDRQDLSACISSLMQGNPRSPAHRWLQSKGIQNPGVLKTQYPVPVTAQIETVDGVRKLVNPKIVNELEVKDKEGNELTDPVVGYAAIVSFSR